MIINIRKIKLSDKEDILQWRNDINSRKNSLNTKLLNNDEHHEWYTKIIHKYSDTCFIAENGKKKLGFIFYKIKSYNKLYVSINLNPKFRGKGIGSKILILSSKKLIINGFKGIFYAKIKKNNTPSINSFTKAYYIKNRTYDDYVLFSYKVKK